MALTLPKIALPKIALNKKQAPAIALGLIVVAAAGWFGWQYFEDAAPPPAPPSKPQPVKAAKPTAPVDVPQVREKLIEEIKSAPTEAGKQPVEVAQTAAPAPRRTGSMKGADARSCLSLSSNPAIIKCAEQYR